MTKKQIAYFMSIFSFRLLLALVGLMVGLLIARWIWGRFASSWMDAENEVDTLRKDIADQTTKNSKLRKELNFKLESSGENSGTKGATDWYALEGVDKRTVEAFEAYGLQNPEQLNSLSANEQTELGNYLQGYGLNLDKKWISGKQTSETGSKVSSNVSADPASSGFVSDTGSSRTGDSVAGEENSQTADANPTGAVGFVSGENSRSQTGAPMPTRSSDVQPTTNVNEGAGFVEKQEGWDHENRKTIPLQSGDDSKAFSDSKTRFDLPSVHGPKLNWGELEGVDPKLAEKLDDMGIRNINQLEAMSYEQRKVFEAELDSSGLSWNWNRLRGWKAGLAESHGKQNLAASVTVGDSKRGSGSAGGVAGGSDNNEGGTDSGAADTSAPGTKETLKASATARSSVTLQSLGLNVPQAIGPDTDWSELSELDPNLQAELNSLGIRNVEQLASLSFDDRRKLERHFSIKNVNWDWKWLEKWRSAQEGNSESGSGISAANPFTNKTSADDSTKRNESGVAPASPNPVYGFAAGRRDSSSSPNSGASEPVSASSSTASSVSKSRSNDPNQLPVLYTEIPEFRDDLTLLDGIDGPQSIELRKMGIYNFSQLHNLPIEDRARLQSWFRKRGWRLDMDQWRIASEGNTLNPSMEDIQQRAFEVYQHRVYHDLCGGERTDWEQAEWKLRGNPIFGEGVPHDVDDFAVSLSGISPEVRDELYRMGLYNRHQINALDNDARRLLTRWFAGPRFGVDLTQAFGWLSSLKELPQSLNFGQVFSERPRRVDDLSLIEGVEPSTESDLNRIGIYHFAQIANWSPENVSAISETLNLDHSIIHEHWIAQAKKLI